MIFSKKDGEQLISIIMPVKNAGRFLMESLDSILGQSHENWELWAIDDHSRDNSRAILNDYAGRDQRIKVSENPGSGIISALQYGYIKCMGQYIHRMDADDVMPFEKLENLLGVLLKNGPGYLSTGFVEYFRDNAALGDGYRRYAQWLNDLTATGNNFMEIYKECVIPSPCWMIERTDFERLGAFNSSLYPEDYDLCFRIYKAGLKVAGVRKILHLWRDHSDRSSRTDPNYSDNRFLDLKLKYFLELDHDKNKPLFIWGAGKKAKRLARMLQERQINFRWISNNPKKRNVPIYDVNIEPFEVLANINNPQIIVMVANPEEQAEIRDFLNKFIWRNQRNVFFFC